VLYCSLQYSVSAQDMMMKHRRRLRNASSAKKSRSRNGGAEGGSKQQQDKDNLRRILSEAKGHDMMGYSSSSHQEFLTLQGEIEALSFPTDLPRSSNITSYITESSLGEGPRHSALFSFHQKEDGTIYFMNDEDEDDGLINKDMVQWEDAVNTTSLAVGEKQERGHDHDHDRQLAWVTFGATAATAAKACIATVYAAAACAGLAVSIITIVTQARTWFGTPSNDDAWLTVTASDIPYGDGNAMGIGYHRWNERDNDSLGYVGRGQSKTWREDLDAKHLWDVELYLRDTDDICIRNLVLTVGKEPSGRGEVRIIDIPAWILSRLTGSPMDPDCVWFGDENGSLTNFRFYWPKALECYENYFRRSDRSYYRCFTWAMRRHDKKLNGKIYRWTWG